MKKIEDMGLVYSRIRINQVKKKKKYSSKGKIYASMLGCRCDWKLRFQFLGDKEDPNKFIWDGYDAEAGTAVHDLIQKDGIEEGILKSVEDWGKTTIDGVTINFRIDGIFCDGRMVEYKTIKLKEVSAVEGAPRDKDIVQLNFYMGELNFKKTLLTYFKREDGKHVVTWEIDFDEKLYHETIQKIKNVISGNNLKKDKRECMFCSYKESCKAEGKRRK